MHQSRKLKASWCWWSLQAFVGNQATCLKVQSRQLEKMVGLVGEHQERVPELLDLLAAIVKASSPTPLRRRASAQSHAYTHSHTRTLLFLCFSCRWAGGQRILD